MENLESLYQGLHKLIEIFGIKVCIFNVRERLLCEKFCYRVREYCHILN